MVWWEESRRRKKMNKKTILAIFWQSYFIILIALAPLFLVKGNGWYNWIMFILCMNIGVIGLRLELFKEFKLGDYL